MSVSDTAANEIHIANKTKCPVQIFYKKRSFLSKKLYRKGPFIRLCGEFVVEIFMCEAKIDSAQNPE